MSREILFKGQRKSDRAWIYGNLLRTDDGIFIIQNHVPYHLLSKYEVLEETVCEYTGLQDKNGRKIFEGDFVKINNDVKETFKISDGAVVYRGGSFIVGGNNGNGTLNSLFVITDINYVLRGEVIGNIFDNLELL